MQVQHTLPATLPVPAPQRHTRKESLCRSTAFWKWHCFTSFCKMVFSWVSRCALAFSALRARANALLFCFRETFIVEELSVRNRAVSHTIGIQGLIHNPPLIIILSLPRPAFLRSDLYNSIDPSQNQQYPSSNRSLQRKQQEKIFLNNMQHFRHPLHSQWVTLR